MDLIFYLHGFASGPKPKSPKIDFLRALGHEVHCLATQGGYRPEHYLHAAEAALSMSPAPQLLVSSSLGALPGCAARLPLDWLESGPGPIGNAAEALAHFIARATAAGDGTA
jgi:hypothetical protein